MKWGGKRKSAEQQMEILYTKVKVQWRKHHIS